MKHIMGYNILLFEGALKSKFYLLPFPRKWESRGSMLDLDSRFHGNDKRQ